jgi:hypothetical protein
MGSKETRLIPKHACTGRLVIVALSAQPPGVNELCVCVCISESSRARSGFTLILSEQSRTSGASSLPLHRVSSHRRTGPISCFSHLPRRSDELITGTVYVAGSLWSTCFTWSPKQTDKRQPMSRR